MDMPSPPDLADIVRGLSDLVKIHRTAAALPALRSLAEAGRKYADDLKAWAAAIPGQTERLVGDNAAATDPIRVREQICGRLRDLEAVHERNQLPALWKLKEQRVESENYPPAARAAWVSAIDPIIEAIEVSLEAIRRLRFRYQDDIDDLRQTRTRDTADKLALEAYRLAAEKVFGVKCDTEVEEFRGQKFYRVKIPVDPGIPHPHRALADKETRVHELIEAVASESAGRAILRYVPARAA